MAKRRTTKRSSQGGSTLYGVLAGLLLGLVVAAAVAFYVTQAPMPFVDKASRENEQSKLPDPRQAPDPNGGLYGRDGAAGTAPSGPTATAPSPLPGLGNGGSTSAPSNQDDLGALIATLPSTQQPATRAPAANSAQTGASQANGATGGNASSGPSGALASRSPTPASSAKPTSSGSYLLQAGAYRVLEDAESLRARIILLGLPVAVQRAEVNGMQINRVRVGPFARLDDMNRARSQLGENKIESAVVRE